MAKLQPWYKIVTPRKDLREGSPLDASEFAVHLDQVRDGRASDDYQNPEQFFERTYLTKSLLGTAGEVLRRLSGKKIETSPVFNMATQFGGGKTHALTLLYHLAEQGAAATRWQGVGQILAQAGIREVPGAATAVFVGTEFDSITGRGGDNGSPWRRTPWGEIAFQLSGEAGFRTVEEHEKQATAPSGEVIRSFLPKDKPSLILIDELMNYVSRSRKSGLATQLYNFIQNLSEEARGNDNVVLVVSIPASELEMSAEDQSDYERFKKMLDRLGKAVVMSAEAETSEIIRRRLFEWDPRAVSGDGKVLLPKEALQTAKEYAEWLQGNRAQIPGWFPVDHAQAQIEATYPFHPSVLSVFERKWQELPRFQQTRGILRLLALWVSNAYQQGFKGAEQVPLIGLGTAPLEDAVFRQAMFEQLGENKLEGPVTTDICGKGAHAVRLDEEAVDTIRKAQLHKKTATAIFFESNGGQSRNDASLPEIRLAVAGPHIDLGNVETALEALSDSCYYLTTEGSRYRFSTKENLTKRYADRRATIRIGEIDRRVREEIQQIFPRTEGVEILAFPEKSSQIQDRPVITLVVMGPDHAVQDDRQVAAMVEQMTKEYGKSARTYKSALIWVVPESSGSMREEARKLLAWEAIQAEGLKLDEVQQKQLGTNLKRAKRDLTESVWRAYKNVLLLGKHNEIKTVDLGLVTSSSHSSLPGLILHSLRQKDEVEKGAISARFLVRNWPPAFTEWSTKAVRDSFFASPLFPRLLDPETIAVTVSQGVADGLIAYVGKSSKGSYDPFCFKRPLSPGEVEISEDMYIITADEAEKHLQPPVLTRLLVSPSDVQLHPGTKETFTVRGLDQFGETFETGEPSWKATGGEIAPDGVFTAGEDAGRFLVTAQAEGVSSTGTARVVPKGAEPPPPSLKKRILWEGEVPHQKWTNLYMKVLTRLVSSGKLSLTLRIEAAPEGGATDAQVEELRRALRGLGMDDDVRFLED